MGDGTRLVGRHHELDRLAAALEGGVVSVSGEPGVGKTTVVRAFASTAADRGVPVLWGSCFEGSAQPPYGPWEAALAPLGVELPEIAELSAPEARLRRSAGVHQALVAAAPRVIVLDDLQWASTETLDLLAYVAARSEGVRMSLVTTHRDPDPALEGTTPLTLLLADLARLPHYVPVALAGLSTPEVAAFLATSFGDEVPGAIVRAVRDHTGGNPFYVREVAKALVEDGRLVRRDGRWSSDFSLSELGIPVTVRHGVRGRLARLHPRTQALLQAAAAFSGDFGLDPVRDVAGLDEDEALDAVDEALATGFLQRAVGGRPEAPYAFAHAIVGDALHDALSPDRAARQHRRAALALERHRPDDRAAIAEQYWLSRSLPGAEAGVAHALVAADRASAQHASRRAARLLRLARELGDAHDAEVLRRLAVAEAQDLDADAAAATTRLALEGLAVDDGVDLVVEVVEALREGTPPSVWVPLVRRGLDLVGDGRGPAWARLAVLLDPVETVGPVPRSEGRSGPVPRSEGRSGPVPRSEGRSGPVPHLRVGRWRCYPPEAVAALRSTGREDDEARAIDPFCPRSEAETEDLMVRSSAWARPRPRMRALDLAGRDLSLRHGRPRAAVDCYRQLLDLGQRVGSMPAQAEAHGQLALCLALCGDLRSAEGHLATSAALTADLWPGHRLHMMGTVSSASVVAYMLRDGDWVGLAQRLDQWLGTPMAAGAPFANVFAALAATNHALAGEAGAARRRLADVVAVLKAMSPFDHAVAGSLWFSAAAAWELGDRASAERLVVLTDRHRDAGGPPGPASLHHAAGRLAAVLGRDDASAHLQAARRHAEAAGSQGVAALVDYDLAVVSGDRAAVAAAARRFEALGMRGWAHRARPALRQPSGLTGREVEVLRLVAAGRTSAEIADALVVAPATVNRHIANIYAKIGARNRAEATSFAIAHGLHTSV